MQYAVILGVGITMDNMLYIIAGLVLILIVVGVVSRKNKAKKPSTPPSIKSEKSTATPAPIPKKADHVATKSTQDDDNKFDHVATAQRFMDQQRYDKAIETLDRGLGENPDNSQLTLKLLSIYATINQPENFNKVYDIIKTQNDSKSIALADELKSLFSEEQHQAAAKEAPVEDNDSFDSIDFDLSSNQDDNNNTLIDETIDNPTLSSDVQEISTTSENTADEFDLTLSDLESSFDEPATSLDIKEDESLDESSADNTVTIEDNDLSDFEFNFDSPEDTNTEIESPITSDTPDSTTEDMLLDSEEFVLDFDDLAADADESIVEELNIDTIQNQQEKHSDLSLDSLDVSDNVETVLDSEKTVSEEESDFDNLVLEDGVFEDSDFEDRALENSSLEANIVEKSLVEEDSFEAGRLEEENLEVGNFEDTSFEEELLFNDSDVEKAITEDSLVEESSFLPTAALLLDGDSLGNHDLGDSDLGDSGLIDNFVSESPTATTPVEIETEVTTEESIETTEEFSSRFAADFDFVKSLDSNQVTLDLAAQYLQLGEYDSAKRLLNEVMAQGNSEQQSQAQTLLERTA